MLGSIRSFLTLLALVAIASPAMAQLVPSVQGDVHRDTEGRAWLVDGLQLPTRGETPILRALDGLRQLPAIEVDRDRLVPVRVRDAHGLTMVRFGRVVDAGDTTLPVRNGSLIVALDGSGRVRFVVDHSGPRDIAPQPAVAENDALAIEAAFGDDTAGVQLLEQREVALDLGGELLRVRELDLARERHERFRVYLDGDGVLVAHTQILHGLGRVWEPNPVLADDMTTDVELLHLTSARFLTGRYVRASSCDPDAGSCNPIQRAEANVDGDFLYDPVDPSFDDEFAEVNIYHHADKVAAYFRDTHGLEWSCCDTSSIIDVIANYVESRGEGYANAFFSPPQCSRGICATMAFGQGNERDFGYDGDIVYHEYGHGIVDVTSEFTIFILDPRRGVKYDPGALNEAISDYFSATLGDDPNLADYFEGGGIGSGEGALRNLAGDLRCPDDLFGEIHQDGIIWGQALWSIREAIGADKTDALAFAWLNAVPSDADFAEASEVLLTTAESLPVLDAADVEAVGAELDRRGLSDCEPIVPLEDEVSHLGFSGNGQITGSLGGGVAPLMFRVDVPADATSLKFQMSRLTLAGQWDVYFRVDTPPQYRTGRTPPLVHDFAAPGFTEVTFTEGDADFPLPRCSTLYLAIVSTDLMSRGENVYTLYSDLETSGDPSAECPEPPAPDMGVAMDGGVGDGSMEGDGDDDDDGGCGCRVVTPADESSAPLWLAAFGLLLLQRRRTRSSRRSSVSKKTVPSAD